MSVVPSTMAGRLRVSPQELADLLRRGQHDWVVVSGKMASGKDTVAAEVNARMYGGSARILRYGDLMRAELDVALEAWRSAPSGADLVQVVGNSIGLPAVYASDIIAWLGNDMDRRGGRLTSYERTNGIRAVLQALGGPWRTTNDEDYWARTACLAALRARAEGPVLLTGGRFAPDVEIPALLGATVLRIDVSEDVQRERLARRDGLSPDPATLRHPGEVILDDWDGFTSRLDGNQDLLRVTEQACQAIMAARPTKSRRRATAVAVDRG